jgi:renalase
MDRIAIIGAGLAGLTIARRIGDIAQPVILEKSRGTGGRMATRRAPPFAFDHGAQFFTAKEPEFEAVVKSWQQAGVVKVWQPRFAELDRGSILAERDWDASYPHFVGAPGMSAIGRHLSSGLDIRLQTPVASVNPHGSDWQLVAADGSELGLFQWVIATAPAAQSAALLPGSFAHHDALSATRMQSCFALMLGFEAPPHLPWQAALVRNADISWVSVNSSKPGRPEHFTLVAHSTNAFADAHIDEPLENLQQHLYAELRDITGIDAKRADFCQLHRWRYANIDSQSGATALVDADRRLAACGDWCIRGRIEAAFSSAVALTEQLRAALVPNAAATSSGHSMHSA